MPFYADSVLDEVRNSVNIVSLVSEYVALKKRGRNHVARCPFHNEKTPSFNVNEEKQIFMCFGCGLGGDIFKFVMQIENLTFPEAVRFIAERRGITLPQSSAPDKETTGTRARDLREIMEAAADFYHHTLVNQPEGRSGLKYLHDRGVETGTIEQFRIGFSPPGGNSLIQLMKGKGCRLESLQECGLVKHSEDGERFYDSFRGRIMFPITDVQGRVVAFGGRAMGDWPPKYLNSPETKLYNKSRNLFGLSFSREAIKESDRAVLVEGYMDFLIPFQHGVKNLVASLGTSLTTQQVELLGRYTRDVVVSYDPDSAGIAATQRSLDLFLEGDFRVKVLQLSDNQDPDEFVRTAGPEAYQDKVREAAPYLEFVLDSAIKRQGSLEDPKKKIQVINAILPYLARLPSAVERSEYVFKFARKLGIEDQQLLAETKRAARQKKDHLEPVAVTPSQTMKFAEKRLLQLLLGDADLQHEIIPLCSQQDFQGLVSEKIFSILLEEYNKNEPGTYESMHRRLAGEEEQALLAQLQLEEMPEDPSRDTAESFLNALRTMRLASYKQKIQMKIAEAAEQNDDELLNQLIEQRVMVDRELVSLSRK
ncbi:MAG: DNA primase [Acidobacteria bacterium]|nr:DNA primase [Acidobacteriota bacterium]